MKLTIASRETAERLLTGGEGDALGITHAIGIADTPRPGPGYRGRDRAEPVSGWGKLAPDRRLFLAFDDLEVDFQGYRRASRSDVEEIARFGWGLPADAHLLCHCEQGISRSSAAALVALAAYAGPGDEEEVARVVYQARPIARPNGWVVKLGDELLARRGALVRVARAVSARRR